MPAGVLKEVVDLTGQIRDLGTRICQDIWVSDLSGLPAGAINRIFPPDQQHQIAEQKGRLSFSERLRVSSPWLAANRTDNRHILMLPCRCVFGKMGRACQDSVNSTEGMGGRCRRNHDTPISAATTAALPMAAFLCRLMMLAMTTESDTDACGGWRTGSADAGAETASDRLELVSRFSRFRSVRISDAC
jgi:hypothetical protein